MSDDMAPSAGASVPRFVLVADREFPQCLPQQLVGDAHRASVLAVLYDRTPDAWLRDWQPRLGETSTIDGVLMVGASQRSGAARTAPAQPATRSPPRLTAIEQPADLQALERAIQSYLETWPAASTQGILWVESLAAVAQQTSLATVGDLLAALEPRLAAANALAYLALGPETEGPTERLRTALLSGAWSSAAAPDQPRAVAATLVAEVGRELTALRRDDPATYARLESHWQSVKIGLDHTELNYAKADQIYRTLDEPACNVQTFGWTLNGLAALGVLDVWDGQTNGPNRYDLTRYDPARFAAVSLHLASDTHLTPGP